jgi:hypothetical protein
MRSTLRMTFLALLAVFALSAVAAASASASPEWYVKKGGVFKKAGTAVKVNFTGTYELYYHPKLGSYRFSCTVGPSSELISGTIEAASLGSITKFSPAFPETECKGVKEKLNVCESGVEAEKSANLPWATELYSEGTEKRIRIKSGGSLPPVTEWKCRGTIFECDLNTTARVNNKTLPDVVEATFDAKSNKVVCNNGAKAEGEWKGTLTIAPSEAEKKAGVEGIKVE